MTIRINKKPSPPLFHFPTLHTLPIIIILILDIQLERPHTERDEDVDPPIPQERQLRHARGKKEGERTATILGIRCPALRKRTISATGMACGVARNVRNKCVYTAIKIALRYDNKIVVNRALYPHESAHPIHTENARAAKRLTGASSPSVFPSQYSPPSRSSSAASHPAEARRIIGMMRAARERVMIRKQREMSMVGGREVVLRGRGSR